MFRMEQYLRMGYAEERAESLAERDDVDWHRVEDILAMCQGAGCKDPLKVTYRMVI